MPRPVEGGLWCPRSEADFSNAPTGSLVCRGAGMSYNGAALLRGGVAISSTRLDRILSWDAERGVLEVESGVSIRRIVEWLLPKGWMLPVVPGTGYVSVGGCIAADVHGKNHHVKGSFGAHVESVKLWAPGGFLRANRQSPVFAATVGGLGGTGFIVSAELKLERVPSNCVDSQVRSFETFAEFENLDHQFARSEFTAAWIDMTLRPGSGLMLAADYLPAPIAAPTSRNRLVMPRVPWMPKVGTKLMAAVIAAGYPAVTRSGPELLTRYLWPLDRVAHWNRVYGPRGLRQFQAVWPAKLAAQGVALVIECFRSYRVPAPLAVLKRFGEMRSPGLMSFPRPGYTLAVDYPDLGDWTDRFTEQLESLIASRGGAAYLVKNRMPNKSGIRLQYPVEQFLTLRHRSFSSMMLAQVDGS